MGGHETPKHKTLAQYIELAKKKIISSPGNQQVPEGWKAEVRTCLMAFAFDPEEMNGTKAQWVELKEIYLKAFRDGQNNLQLTRSEERSLAVIDAFFEAKSKE